MHGVDLDHLEVLDRQGVHVVVVGHDASADRLVLTLRDLLHDRRAPVPHRAGRLVGGVDEALGHGGSQMPGAFTGGRGPRVRALGGIAARATDGEDPDRDAHGTTDGPALRGASGLAGTRLKLLGRAVDRLAHRTAVHQVSCHGVRVRRRLGRRRARLARPVDDGDAVLSPGASATLCSRLPSVTPARTTTG